MFVSYLRIPPRGGGKRNDQSPSPRINTGRNVSESVSVCLQIKISSPEKQKWIDPTVYPAKIVGRWAIRFGRGAGGGTCNIVLNGNSETSSCSEVILACFCWSAGRRSVGGSEYRWFRGTGAGDVCCLRRPSSLPIELRPRLLLRLLLLARFIRRYQ